MNFMATSNFAHIMYYTMGGSDWRSFRHELEQVLPPQDFKRLLYSYPFATVTDRVYRQLPDEMRNRINEAKTIYLNENGKGPNKAYWDAEDCINHAIQHNCKQEQSLQMFCRLLDIMKSNIRTSLYTFNPEGTKPESLPEYARQRATARRLNPAIAAALVAEVESGIDDYNEIMERMTRDPNYFYRG
jgi:hypothetical protein